MAAKIELTPLPPFDPISDPSSLSQRWKTWAKRFKTYLTALNITDDGQKRAILLYQAGEATQEIFETLPDTGTTYDTAIAKLTAYFSLKKNVDFEVFQFRQAKQKEGETVAQFATRLRKLAATCEFDDLDKELKSAIIQNCESKRLRRFVLREDELTLGALLAKARSLEASESQAVGMENSLAKMKVEQISQVQKSQRRPQLPPTKTNQSCRNCGLSWPHTTSPCPARGQTCSYCGKLNHFAKVCFSKQATPSLKGGSYRRPQYRQPRAHLNQITSDLPSSDLHPSTEFDSHPSTESHRNPSTESHRHPSTESHRVPNNDSSSDDEYLYTTGHAGSKTPQAEIQVHDFPVKMLIDTGASIDIVDEATFSQLARNRTIALEDTNKRLFAYGSDSQLDIVGKFEAALDYQGRQTRSSVHVVRGGYGCLLSCKTATELGLIDVHVQQIQNHQMVSDQLIQQYPHLFEGIGKLKDFEVHLHIDQSVPPVAQPHRRIPFHMRKKVEQELENLEKQGIIEKVEGPTPWVSPLVATPKKNGDARICVDMRRANQAIQRERHPSPTVDDLTHTLNGSTVFSKLDLRAGYHQLLLAPESRYITTFATHKGLRRYARLNFGTNSASEIFQHIIQELLRDIPGALNISDDVIVFGTCQADHDQALRAVFKKFSESGLTLNKKKCQFNMASLEFFGFIFSAAGVSPDPKKVEAIHKASPPTSTSGIRSFLGMATYCAKFIPNFSDVSLPLRELTKKNIPFQWGPEQDRAFNEIKTLLTSDQVVAYFDQAKETELVTDASPYGLSAILSQKSPGQEDRRVVAYVSRSLSDVERRYSQTEKEALAIVWAIERLHLYLCGAHFTLHTDCKPVELIFGNASSKPPARIERWNLRLQGYDFSIAHTKGILNPSDFLSRHPNVSDADRQDTLAEDYVNFLVGHAVPKAMSLSEIQQATKEDNTLQYLAEVIRGDIWDEIPSHLEGVDLDELKLFSRIKDELTVNSETTVILRDSRIVIPTALRQRALALAHEGHQGLVKTKKLLREKVWFPGIDDQVKEMVEKCIPCQANGPENKPDPLQMSPLPPEPWHTVHMDFSAHLNYCSIAPSGQSFPRLSRTLIDLTYRQMIAELRLR